MIHPNNNHNFRMISHQGFSVTDQWLGNSRVSSYVGSAEQDLSPIIAMAEKCQTDLNTITINMIYTKHPVEEIMALNQRLPRGVRLEVWIIDEPDVMYKYLPYVSGFTTNTISPKDL